MATAPDAAHLIKCFRPAVAHRGAGLGSDRNFEPKGEGMQKPTKKAKKVDIKGRLVTGHSYSYTCPHCKTAYTCHWSMKKVIRFRCDCGQELVVNSMIME